MAGEDNPFAKYVGTGAAPPPRRQPAPGMQPAPRVQNAPLLPGERGYVAPQRREPKPPAAPPAAPVAAPVEAVSQPKPVEEENPFAKFAGKSVKADKKENADPLASLDVTGPFDEVRGRINQLPPEHRKPALDRWADSVVAKEREGGGFLQGVDDRARRMATGIVGGWGDRLGAKISSAIGGAAYDEALAYEQSKSRAATKSTSSKVGSLPYVGDVTEGDLWGLGGGVAAAPLVPMLPVSRALPLLSGAPTAMASRMVNAGATAAPLGYAIGYGSGNTDEERAKHAKDSALLSGGLGLLAPPIARGLGNAAGGIADAVRPLPAQLQNYTRGAVDRFSRAFEADAPANTAVHGGEGMLADLGPMMRETTGAMMATPGAHQGRIYNAVQGRRTEAANRINADVDATLGPAQNLVQLEENVTRQAKRNAGPLYDQYYQSQIPHTPGLSQILKDLPKEAIDAAKKLARYDRVDIMAPDQAPRLLDYIKRGLDDVARDAPRGSHLERSASNLARDLRGEVDRALSPADPAQSVWAQARRAAGEGKQFQEGLEEGRNAFSKSTHPDQMRADLAGANAPYEAGFVAGGRGQIRDIMGNAGAAYGPNGDIAALKNLNAPYAQQKFAQLVAPQDAARLGGRLNAEAAFNRTYEDVLRNSKTAVRQATQKGLPNPEANGGAGHVPHTVVEVVGVAVKSIANALSGGVFNARNRQIITDMADMAIAQGARRDQIAQGLRDYLTGTRANAQTRQAVSRAIAHIMAGEIVSNPGRSYSRSIERTH